MIKPGEIRIKDTNVLIGLMERNILGRAPTCTFRLTLIQGEGL